MDLDEKFSNHYVTLNLQLHEAIWENLKKKLIKILVGLEVQAFC